MALPAGVVSDRIGRKRAFILGDGGGAALALIQIFATSDWLLLSAPVLGGFFGNLHGVTEPAFMAENSRPRERVHLFSIGAGLGTVAAAVGSIISGSDSLLHVQGLSQAAFYRYATLVGIIWWFLSLIPAVMLKEIAPPAPADSAQKAPARRGLRLLAGTVRNPHLVLRLVIISGLIAFGAGFGVRLMNVFLHDHVHADHGAIGVTFAIGQIVLAVGALLVPFVVERLGKVGTVVLTRPLSVPFIMMFAFSPELAGTAAPALTVAGMAFAARMLFMNMGAPAAEAFEMEQLHPSERATTVGLQTAVASGGSAVGVFLGSRWMDQGIFTTPYLIMAAMYALATVLYWVFFRRTEAAASPAAAGALAD